MHQSRQQQGTTEQPKQRLAGDLSHESSAGQLVSLNGIYPMLKGLPLALWRDNRGRQEGLHNVLLVMDELTRQEKLPVRPGDDSRAEG